MLLKQSIFFATVIFSICLGYKVSAQQPEDNLHVVRNCGDWRISIISQTDSAIKVEDCAWGMGWSCNTYDIPKTVTQGLVNIYAKDQIVFINYGEDWMLLGHICADNMPDSKPETKPIFTQICNDRKLSVMSETDEYIMVESCGWINGWFCGTHKIQKATEINKTKIYSHSSLWDLYGNVFINNENKWSMLGNPCSNLTDIFTYKCPNTERFIKITYYKNSDLIIVNNINCKSPDLSGCKAEPHMSILFKDTTSARDQEIFIKDDFYIERTLNGWVVDNKLCD